MAGAHGSPAMSDAAGSLLGMARTAKLDGAALAALLRAQDGVISRGQARAAGVTSHALSHRLRAGGPWQIMLPGVYLAVTGAPTAPQRDMAALLYAGPRSVLTGVAALRRHRIPVPGSDVIDVLVPVTGARRRQSLSFVRVRLTTQMPEQVCVSGKVVFAMVARALADAARGMADAHEVRALVAGAVQQGRCPLSLLATELGNGPVQGSAHLRLAVAEARAGVRSSAEADLKILLKRARLPEPMFNARLYIGGELLAVADAWWPDAGVVAEVDSREWHLLPAHWERTQRRHAAMSAHGILVLHFPPSQIRNEPAAVVAAIRSALKAGRARPPLRIRALPAAA
jgi:very-short-patch-repair endonuclease